MKIEEFDTKTQLLLYVKISSDTDPKAIFCTSDMALQKAGDELIACGMLIEIEGPGGLDRAFALTELGKTKLGDSGIKIIDNRLFDL